VKDALGKSLEEIFKIVPGGCLVFFPSYKLMEKLCNRWHETGQWSQLYAEKALFVGNTSFFSLMLFYLIICKILWKFVMTNVKSLCALFSVDAKVSSSYLAFVLELIFIVPYQYF